MSPDWRGNRSVSVSMTYPEITQLDQITVNHLNEQVAQRSCKRKMLSSKYHTVIFLIKKKR